ncbi:response regulator transcription factor [Paenibacillus larvae]|uniref:Heme response regulator HssR n=1 Tax=Paenibacillus larvae TaxID=1464 RepID=A0AAP5JYU6_9BACL|nr:response regulator transcription factor [Paenibacillus larvae]MDE5128208.1 response regulator transcription factor [Paenibacillus larvae subsp. larvae]MDE5135931.1 response regulator transcription factor [Paenibacillus larvae subsp. larvae]MDE5139897.1 response regulator transcription factor [Paenibacillus larvae subsp. larvae]MDE5144023.1 response regulator transcription factor [Paenibacillus larvae subsp. larvae]MDE5151846.1 response regulator transcription factor [Paenibacillus larvae su
MMNILIADDDIHIYELIRYYLQKEGFKVLEAKDGEEASALLEQETVDLAIVDVMMPNKDGYELCREIRRYYDIPVIMLTAKGEIPDKEKGYQAGTDDYLVKPFEPKELVFRIKALLRRFGLVSSDTIQLNNTVIDRKSYEIRCKDKTLILPLKEFELLSQLASCPDRIFTREQLISLVWGQDFTGDARTVDVHIKRLRERFSQTDDFIITTVRGLGYKLEIMEPSR